MDRQRPSSVEKMRQLTIFERVAGLFGNAQRRRAERIEGILERRSGRTGRERRIHFGIEPARNPQRRMKKLRRLRDREAAERELRAREARNWKRSRAGRAVARRRRRAWHRPRLKSAEQIRWELADKRLNRKARRWL